jgi:hypothetical protein
MKNVPLWIKVAAIAVIIIIVILVLFWAKSCINRPIRAAYQAGIADGKADVYEKQVKPLAVEHATVVAENATLKKAVSGVEAENTRLKNIIAGNTVVLTDLEAARKNLTDKDAIIANLDQQVLVHKTNEAVWEDRYNGEHGLRLKLQGNYDDLFAKYEKVYAHDQAGADALKAMTLDRDLYKKASRSWISPWVDRLIGGGIGYGAAKLFGAK